MPTLAIAEQTPGSVFNEMFAGTLSTGATLPMTVTVCAALPVLPAASVAVHVIVVTPMANAADSGTLSLRAPETVTS